MRQTIEKRVFAALASGPIGRRDLALDFGVPVSRITKAIEPHISAGSILVEQVKSAAGRPMTRLRLASNTKAEITERPCLKCRNPFLSYGAMNRICPGCRVANQAVSVLAP